MDAANNQPPSPGPTDEVLGAYLRSLRLNAGLDVAVLARRVSLSAAQVLELESGRGSLFYNRRIRLQAARKTIAHLGGDLACLSAGAPEPAVLADPLPALLAAQSASASSTIPGGVQAAQGGAPRSWGAAALLLAVLAGLGIIAATRGPTASDRSPQTAERAGTPAPTPESPAPAAVRRPLDLAAAPMTEPVAAPTTAQQAGAQEPAAPEQERKRPPDQAARVTREELSACAWRSGEVPVYQPTQARKPGDMVYVVSQVSQVLCVADATGKPQVQRLEPGQGLSFYGQPPWQVASAQLQQTQLYFQGWKVRLPAQAQNRIQLVELP